jgi:hypothetical protein
MKKSLSILSLLLATAAFAQVDVNASSGTETATYTTVTAAFDAINAGTHQGIINITITANTSETGTSVLNRRTGTSNFASVTLKPAAATTPYITNTAAGPVFRILGSNVTIDGSNNGTDSRDLSIVNGNVAGNQVIAMGSSDVANPLTNVTVKNTNVINGVKTSGYGIIVSNTAGSATAGYFKNINIENNTVQRSFNGIYLLAVSAAGNGSGSVITKNDLSASGDNSNRSTGIYLGGTDGVAVSANKIGNFDATVNEAKRGMWLAVNTMNTTVSDNIIDNIGISTVSGGSATGIQIFTNAGAGGVPSANKILRNKISNLFSGGLNSSVTGIGLGGSTVGTVISQNTINNLVNKKSGTTPGIGAEGLVLGAATASNTLVSNNFISKISSFGTSFSGSTGGILINGGSGYKIYNNSVYLTETQNDGVTKGLPIALSIAGITAAGSIDVRNNIFVASLADNSVPAYAASVSFSSTFSNTDPKIIFTNFDHNIFYSSTNLAILSVGSTQTILPALSNLQTTYGNNANSLQALPKFISDTDLHILQESGNSAIDNKGSSLTDVPADFDNEARSATTPDIGADEFTIETLAVDAAAGKAKIQIYPNPVNDVLTVSSDKKVSNISVYNVAGQMINNISNSNTINLAKLSSGVYFVKTVVEGQVEMTKIIKK